MESPHPEYKLLDAPSDFYTILREAEWRASVRPAHIAARNSEWYDQLTNIIAQVGMAVTDLTIRDIKARAVVAPLKRPVRTAVRFLLRPSSLIDVLTEQGQPEFW